MRLQGTHQSVGEIDHKHGEIRTIVHGRLLHRHEIFQAPILFGITKIELQLETGLPLKGKSLRNRGFSS